MNQLVLASKPLVTITLRSYEIAQASLMVAKSISHCEIEQDALQSEIDALNPLIEQAADVLKNMEE